MASSIETPLAALREDIRASIMAGVVPAVRGPAGVGKTSIFQAIAKDLDWNFHVEIGSLSEPTDIAGFPVVAAEGHTVVTNGQSKTLPKLAFAPREWMLEVIHSPRPTLVLIDELTSVPPATRAPLLRMLQTGCIGDVVLPRDKVAFAVAFNPPGEAVNGSDLEFPMTNRLDHYDFPMEVGTVEEWCADFPGYWGNPPVVAFGTDNKRTIDPEYLIRARSYVAGYLRKMPAHWHYTMINHDPGAKAAGKAKKGQQAGDDQAAGNEFPTAGAPTPRSWDRVSVHLAHTLQQGADPTTALRRIAAAIGFQTGAAFQSHMREADLPDPRALLANPTSYVPKGRIDVDFAVMMSVATVVLAAEETDPHDFLAALKIANIAHTGGPKGQNTRAVEAAYAAVRHLITPMSGENAGSFNRSLISRFAATKGNKNKESEYAREMAALVGPFQAMMGKLRQGL